MNNNTEHIEKMEKLRKAGAIKVQDLQEFLTFVLDSRDDIEESNDVLNFYIPVDFAVDKAFGLDVCTSENEDYVNVYLDYDFHTEEIKVEIYYCNNTTRADDFVLDVTMTEEQRDQVRARFKKEFHRVYGKSIREYWTQTT